MAIGILEKQGLAVVEPDPNGSRFKLARLTAAGGEARDAHLRLLDAIEGRWRTRFGDRTIDAVREPLERLSCSADWSPTPTDGAHPFAGPTRFRTTRWCSTAAASRTAAERSGVGVEPTQPWVARPDRL